MIFMTQTLTEQDYRLAFNEYLSHNARVRVLYILGTLLIITGILLFFTDSSVYFSIAIFFPGALFLFNKRWSMYRYIKNLSHEPLAFSQTRFHITEDGFLEITVEQHTSRIALKDFYQALDAENYLLLFPHPRRFHIFKKNLLSLEDYHHIEDIIFHNIPNHRTIFQTRKH